MISFAARLVAIALMAPVIAACSSATSSPKATRHVFIIVMENKSPDEALAGWFTASLAANNGVAAKYHAITHPSVPNYLALTSGSTWDVQDDSYHQLPRSDIGDQLTTAGISWHAYMEGMTSQGCINSPLPYDPGHNPFAFYGGKCPQNVVPLTQLNADLATNTPMFTWITPDSCHDEHSCPVSAGDDWLSQTVPMITSSAAWKADGLLFIVWDEDDGNGDNRVLALVIRPGKAHKESQAEYNHYSLLATIEDALGVARLGEASKAHAMSDLV
jgi:phosphatidylinositol-3-phosphatase